MRDRQIPMAPAELLTVTPPEAAPKDSFGTAVLQKVKKHHTGLTVLLCVGLVLLATVLAIIGISQMKLVFANGKLTLRSESEAPAEETAPDEQELQPNANAAPGQRTQPGDITRSGLELGSQAPAGAEELSVQELYERTAPGVVCVSTEGFGGTETGTGIILDENGYILTASDTVSGGTEITVICHDGTAAPAQLIGFDNGTGFALLHCELTGLSPVSFGDTSAILVGDPLYCIGNPYGSQMRNVLSEGILSGKGNGSADGQPVNLLHTTAAFGAGNNGCPIFDRSGAVIGVTCTIGAEMTAAGDDPNFALCAEDVQAVAQRIAADAAASGERWLGFEIEPIPETYRYYFRFPGTLWIRAVGAGTYADGALSVYDVILSVDGVSVTTPEEYRAVLAAHKVGELLELRIFRGGFYYKITLPLEEK